MKKSWKIFTFAVLPVFFVLFIFGTVFALFVVKFLWSWTIPDLFPGAVEQGLIASSISWYTAFKLAIFLAIFGAIAGANRRSQNVNKD